MAKVSQGILILFVMAPLVVLLWTFIRGKEWCQWKNLNPASSLKLLIAAILPFAVMLLLSNSIGLPLAEMTGYFCAAAAIPFVLSMLRLSTLVRALVLLLAAFCLTIFVEPGGSLPLVAALGGLTVWKAVENVTGYSISTLEDFLPAFVYLTGTYWINTSLSSTQAIHSQALLLGTIAVAVLLRWMETPFLSDDKFYLKRIMLATTGGLGLLLVIMKSIVAPELAKIAILAGAGFFLTYLFQAMEGASEGTTPTLAKALKQVLLIGIFTLLATRLPFGTVGLLILAASTMVATVPGVAQLAGAFWATRALLQAFIFQHNPNVTGINITHAYANAALYAGFLLVFVMSLFMRDIKDRRILATLFVAAGTLTACVSNYFLHAEPTGALLASAILVAILISILGPVMYGKQFQGHQNILLLPAQLITFALLTSDLITSGNEATIEQKLAAFAVVAGIALLISLMIYFMSPGIRTKPAPTTSQ